MPRAACDQAVARAVGGAGPKRRMMGVRADVALAGIADAYHGPERVRMSSPQRAKRTA